MASLRKDTQSNILITGSFAELVTGVPEFALEALGYHTL